MDIWSAGCIFAELIMRRQLFPGREAAMQIKMLVYYLGTPEPGVGLRHLIHLRYFILDYG